MTLLLKKEFGRCLEKRGRFVPESGGLRQDDNLFWRVRDGRVTIRIRDDTSHSNSSLMPSRNSPSSGQSNAATAIALLGLLLISAALLGLMALVLPQVLGILVVILIFAVPAVFHYLLWGWWLSRVRDRESDADVEDGG
jgi:hypothetical protein